MILYKIAEMYFDITPMYATVASSLVSFYNL